MDITDECETVTGDSAGQFLLTNKQLGTWSVQETIPPTGYFGDSEIRTMELTTDYANHTFDAWVNELFPGRTLETGTTCEMYRDGTAIALNEILFGTKGKTINNVAPGVFFYYTKFVAPSEAFVIAIHQENDHLASFDFLVQNDQQVRLFNGDCSSPTASFTSGINGDTIVNILGGATPGQEFILSVKYETSIVVGQTAPNKPVNYSYRTVIDNAIVDQDLDGLVLRKK